MEILIMVGILAFWAYLIYLEDRWLERKRTPKWALALRKAENPRTSAKDLFSLSTHEDWRVRGAVIENPNVTPAILANMVNDDHWINRKAVAENIKALPETLAILKDDKHTSVQDAAAITIMRQVKEKFENNLRN